MLDQIPNKFWVVVFASIALIRWPHKLEGQTEPCWFYLVNMVRYTCYLDEYMYCIDLVSLGCAKTELLVIYLFRTFVVSLLQVIGPEKMLQTGCAQGLGRSMIEILNLCPSRRNVLGCSRNIWSFDQTPPEIIRRISSQHHSEMAIYLY